MDKRMSEALDRHITGNYGEDQYREDVYEESQKELNQNLLKRVRALEQLLNRCINSSEQSFIDINEIVNSHINDCDFAHKV